MVGTDRNQTLSRLWENAVQEHENAVYLISDADGGEITYAEADAVVQAIVCALRGRSLSPGDRIAAWSTFREEAPLLFYAAVSLGLIWVPVDAALSPVAMKQIVHSVDAKLLFVDPSKVEAVGNEMDIAIIQFDAPEHAFDAPEHAVNDNVLCFGDWIAAAPQVSATDFRPSETDAAVILHTSGTTGLPKGVVLSHRALVRSGHLVAQTFGWRSGDVLLSLGDLHAMSGLRNPCVAVPAVGAAAVVPSDRMRGNLFRITETVRRRQCTLLATTPMFIRQMAAHRSWVEKSDFNSLRQIICTGSELRDEVLSGFVNAYKVPVLNYYGLTETGGICAAEAAEFGCPPDASLGRPVGCETDIVDESGAPVPDGEIGELRVRSLQLMTGYWQCPDLTAEVLRDGRLITGDLVRREADGRLKLMGRKREIIKDAAGELIYLNEVERVLDEHGEVREAGVVGFVSSHGDERPAAFIVPVNEDAAADELINRLRSHVENCLGRRKVPDRFFLRTSLPRDPLGTLLRNVLAKELDRCPK